VSSLRRRRTSVSGSSPTDTSGRAQLTHASRSTTVEALNGTLRAAKRQKKVRSGCPQSRGGTSPTTWAEPLTLQFGGDTGHIRGRVAHDAKGRQGAARSARRLSRLGRQKGGRDLAVAGHSALPRDTAINTRTDGSYAREVNLQDLVATKKGWLWLQGY
jgi:hypothetical protein